VNLFGPTDRLDMLKKHFALMKKRLEIIKIFSMGSYLNYISEDLINIVNVEPLKDEDKLPRPDRMCLLLDKLKPMVKNTTLGVNDVLFISRYTDTDDHDKYFCRTHHVRGNNGLNKTQLREIEFMVEEQACNS